MNLRLVRHLALLAALAGPAPPVCGEPSDLMVHGLFRDRALVSFGSEQRMLSKGETWQGITLVRADSKVAVFAWQGREFERTMSRHMSGGFTPVTENRVHVAPNNKGQYIAAGSINDSAVTFLIDTGATSVALNSLEARRLGIEFESATPGRAQTAGGLVRAWPVVLERVQVGPIRRHQIRALVLEGSFPTEVLLGMTFLEQLDIRQDQGVMVLSSKF